MQWQRKMTEVGTHDGVRDRTQKEEGNIKGLYGLTSCTGGAFGFVVGNTVGLLVRNKRRQQIHLQTNIFLEIAGAAMRKVESNESKRKTYLYVGDSNKMNS